MAVVLQDGARSGEYRERDSRHSGEIGGSFSQEKAEDLSKMLRTGRLPASIDYLEDRTVGASLGSGSFSRA